MKFSIIAMAPSDNDNYLEDIENDETVRDKTILAFFQTINVDGLKKGNMKSISFE